MRLAAVPAGPTHLLRCGEMTRYVKTDAGMMEKPYGDAIRGLFRDRTGLLHVAWEGKPACGFDGEMVDAIHPYDQGAMWCSLCTKAIVARFPRQERDLRG